MTHTTRCDCGALLTWESEKKDGDCRHCAWKRHSRAAAEHERILICRMFRAVVQGEKTIRVWAQGIHIEDVLNGIDIPAAEFFTTVEKYAAMIRRAGVGGHVVVSFTGDENNSIVVA